MLNSNYFYNKILYTILDKKLYIFFKNFKNHVISSSTTIHYNGTYEKGS